MLNVFLVDDEYIALVRLKDLLSNIPSIKVVGSAYSFLEAIEGIDKTHPDVVFLDVEIREHTGFEVVKSINEKGLFPKIIFVTGHVQYAIRALRSKAIDYLVKPIDLGELKDAVNRIQQRETNILCRTIEESSENNNLTAREKEILELICKAFSSQAIAAELYLSVHTIDTYRRKLLKRFSVKNTQELMALILQSIIHQS